MVFVQDDVRDIEILIYKYPANILELKVAHYGRLVQFSQWE